MSRALTIAEAAFVRLAVLQGLGDRYCGASGHRRAQALIRDWCAAADSLREHTFRERFFDVDVDCVNFWARLDGDQPGRVMLVTHYDTRPWADCDDEAPHLAVPGANDGGCGPALFAELMETLKADRARPTVDLLFCDAEDWHEIDGKTVALGAQRFVDDLDDAQRPDAALEIDMVAGRTVMLDVDVNCQLHDGSYALTLELFQLGRSLGLSAFAMAKPHPYKWIEADHLPFMKADIAAALLMDTDYPEWHTRADTIEACSPQALAQIVEVVLAWIYRIRVA